MKPSTVDEYIAGQEGWKKATFEKLRALLHEADPEITEVIKWSAPYFEDHGRVAWMFAATDWVNFSLHNASLIEDKYKLFEPTENQAMRTIKLREGQKIPEKEIAEYVRAIVANNRAGKKVVFKKAPKNRE